MRLWHAYYSIDITQRHRTSTNPQTPQFDLGKALKAALGGGLSGAAAMVLQVLTLMPLRTVMNYQYRYGTTTTQAAKTLYADGGWTRYYQGLTAALVQGPVSRFGDSAANVGILALLKSNRYLKNLPALAKTVFASAAAAAFRMILTPVDTVKTTMQTDGKAGLAILRSRVRPPPLLERSLALIGAELGAVCACRSSAMASARSGTGRSRQPPRPS